jgi:ribosomal protein L29
MDATKLKVKENQGESDLRRHAEKELETMLEDTEDLSGMSPKDIASLIHELEVHQIELKMQNDELRRIQGELEKTRDRYSHLYDFAPVGYFTISAKGIIDEVNRKAFQSLCPER